MLQRMVGLAVSAVVLGGCGEQPEGLLPEPPLAVSLEALYSENGITLWPANNQLIPVCWLTPGFETEKQQIRDSVARTWEYESQVRFFWYGDCPTSGTVKFVRVLLDVATDEEGVGGGWAQTGTAALYLPSQAHSLHIAIPKATYPHKLRRLQYLAAHEFGHTLGFSHEQHRADAPAPCNAEIHLGTYSTGYDAESLMQSNCHLRGYLSEDLSAFDKVGVASVYGPRRWTNEFSVLNALPDENLRQLADVDGDGDDELVYFRSDGVQVSTADTALRKLNPSQTWIADFGTDAGWVGASHLRSLGDVNADGRADIVGFGEAGVSLSYSTGAAFTPGAFAFVGFHRGSPSWPSPVTTPRMVADVNGDGRADIIGFNDTGTVVSLSQCTGSWCTAGTQFAAPVLALAAFGSSPAQGGWDGLRHPRRVADVNGDGKADLVGFSEWGVIVALSTSTATTVSFAPPALWIADYGADTSAGGWSSAQYPRHLGDLNGDGKADIIGFGHEYVWVSFSTGTTFLPARAVLKNLTVTGGHWLPGSPRFLGDVDNDGKVDLAASNSLGTQVFLGKTYAPGAL